MPSLPPFQPLRHLSPNEQAALDSAEAQIDRHLMEEQHEATQRGLTLQQELSKIVHLALTNKDDKQTLKVWAEGFEKMFRQAGRTTFALDSILLRLDEIEEEVKKGVKITEWSYTTFRYRVLPAFESFVVFHRNKIINGFGIWYEAVQVGIESIETKLDIQIRDAQPPYNFQQPSLYFHFLRVYINLLHFTLLYSEHCPPPEEAQEQWLVRIRILKILEVLVDEQHSFIEGQHISALFEMRNIFERLKKRVSRKWEESIGELRERGESTSSRRNLTTLARAHPEEQVRYQQV